MERLKHEPVTGWVTWSVYSMAASAPLVGIFNGIERISQHDPIGGTVRIVCALLVWWGTVGTARNVLTKARLWDGVMECKEMLDSIQEKEKGGY